MDRWAGLPLGRVKDEWAHELSNFSLEAIRFAFETVKDEKFPPTLPEFLMACRNAPSFMHEHAQLEVKPTSREEARKFMAELNRRFGLKKGEAA